MPLYLEYPKEYFDLYLYGPIFAILMAPFSWMPLGLSVVIWNLCNSAILYFNELSLLKKISMGDNSLKLFKDGFTQKKMIEGYKNIFKVLMFVFAKVIRL